MPSLTDDLWDDAGTPLCREMYGVPVTLTRAGRTSDAITAIADSVDYQVFDSEGFLTTFTSRDYTLPVSQTTIDGTAIEPRAGDVITETIAGLVQQKFEILPIAKMPAVKLSPTGTDWLVHTKRVS